MYCDGVLSLMRYGRAQLSFSVSTKSLQTSKSELARVCVTFLVRTKRKTGCGDEIELESFYMNEQQ